jgi:folate/biopterin transporter
MMLNSENNLKDENEKGMCEEELNKKKKEREERLKNKKFRNQMAYLIISFNQGVSSVSELAVSYFFKDELKLEPASLSQIMSFISIPWMIKPLFGLITDLIPICGYRRKIYIMMCGLINIIGWLTMALVVKSLFGATSILFMINCGLSFSTVLGEAVVVELSQIQDESDKDKNSAKDYVSLFFFCKYVGALVSAYLKGLLVELMHVRHVFLITSFLPWLLIISGFILIESRIFDKEDLANHQSNLENSNSRENTPQPEGLVKQFLTFLCQKFVIVPTLFIIAFMATPSYSDPFFYFLTNELKFSPSDLGKISFFSTLATLIAILMYKWFFKNVNFKIMITVGTIISFIFSFLGYILVKRINLQLGISDFILVLFSNSFLSMLGELILMPMLSLACLLCPKNLEGTVYSFFMSALNFGGIMSGINGSIITTYLGITSKDYHNLDKLILISNILTLVPLPLLLCISNTYFQPELNNDADHEEIEKLKNEDDVKKEGLDNLKNTNNKVIQNDESQSTLPKQS